MTGIPAAIQLTFVTRHREGNPSIADTLVSKLVYERDAVAREFVVANVAVVAMASLRYGRNAQSACGSGRDFTVAALVTSRAHCSTCC
jgi:hypothetical protein